MFNARYPWHVRTNDGFNWTRYIETTKNAIPAPPDLFLDPFPRPPEARFGLGMALEAIDPDHPSLLCAVSVSEVQGARIRLHFEGFSQSYDFWENINSRNIFPVGFADLRRQRLQPPMTELANPSFEWKVYLEANSMKAASAACFPPK